MNPWMRTWDWLSAVAMCFSSALHLHDRPIPQIAHPARVCAMEPRDSTIIYDPQATFVPRTISLLGPQDDHLSPHLDQRPVSEQVGYAETKYRGENNGESLHGHLYSGSLVPPNGWPLCCGQR